MTGSRDKESTYDLYTLEQKSVGAELATVSSEKQSQKNALLETKVSDLENQNADLLQQVNFSGRLQQTTKRNPARSHGRCR